MPQISQLMVNFNDIFAKHKEIFDKKYVQFERIERLIFNDIEIVLLAELKATEQSMIDELLEHEGEKMKQIEELKNIIGAAHVKYAISYMIELFEENINGLPQSEELEQKRRELQDMKMYDEVAQEYGKQIAISEMIELRGSCEKKSAPEVQQKLHYHQQRLQNMTEEDIEYERGELVYMDWPAYGYIDLVVPPRGK